MNICADTLTKLIEKIGYPPKWEIPDFDRRVRNAEWWKDANRNIEIQRGRSSS